MKRIDWAMGALLAALLAGCGSSDDMPDDFQPLKSSGQPLPGVCADLDGLYVLPADINLGFYQDPIGLDPRFRIFKEKYYETYVRADGWLAAASDLSTRDPEKYKRWYGLVSGRNMSTLEQVDESLRQQRIDEFGPAFSMISPIYDWDCNDGWSRVRAASEAGGDVEYWLAKDRSGDLLLRIDRHKHWDSGVGWGDVTMKPRVGVDHAYRRIAQAKEGVPQMPSLASLPLPQGMRSSTVSEQSSGPACEFTPEEYVDLTQHLQRFLPYGATLELFHPSPRDKPCPNGAKVRIGVRLRKQNADEAQALREEVLRVLDVYSRVAAVDVLPDQVAEDGSTTMQLSVQMRSP